MDLTGRNLGKYQLLERVGQGGMAHVYRAHQPTIEREVAIKVLHSHLAEDATFLERFRREAKSLGSLQHPHIVNVIDFDVHDGWYYMVMDYIEGQTLQAMLQRRGMLPVDEALSLTAQLAGALHAAHNRGLVHRDVKPGNVMFADQAGQHPVITDFGLTRLLDNVSITISGAIAGTPTYMSPEAAQGEKVDARGDIYSLGVVLFEMVTGQRPYTGETPLSVIMKIVLEPLPAPSTLNPQLPAAVDAIITKATARRPEDRYQTAAEFETALRDAHAHLAAPPATPSHTGDTVARTQLLQPIAAAPQPTSTTPVAHTPSRDRAIRRGRRLYLSAGALLLVALLAGALFIYGNRGDNGNNQPLVVHTTSPPAATPLAEQPPATAQPTPTPSHTPQADSPTPTVQAPQTIAILAFAPPDGSGQRSYTLTLQEAPAPPSGFHYELWFDLNDRPAPQNAAALTLQGPHLEHSDAIPEELAPRITGARISLEPDFDDDPTIAEVVLSGLLTPQTGLSHLELTPVE